MQHGLIFIKARQHVQPVIIGVLTAETLVAPLGYASVFISAMDLRMLYGVRLLETCGTDVAGILSINREITITIILLLFVLPL